MKVPHLPVALLVLLRIYACESFVSDSLLRRSLLWGSLSRLELAKSANKRKKKTKTKQGGGSVGAKGFGSISGGAKRFSSLPSKIIPIDRSKDSLAFYDFLEKRGAGDNLRRCALGTFPLPDGGSIRGLVALKDINEGDVIIRIPYELAVNLGEEGTDPSIPGVDLLSRYCQAFHVENPTAMDYVQYYRMLPKCLGEDCLGSTDFFSDEALDALQTPFVANETKDRRSTVQKRFEEKISSDSDFPKWIDQSPVTEEHLRWAVWLITSRVLTVRGDEGHAYRLLIPLLDMCNHDNLSQHVLKGRAVPGGELKVIAGTPVKAGEQINIPYGGGLAGNDRFIQDYGFVDPDMGFNIVALQLLGEFRGEGVRATEFISGANRKEALEALQQTTIEQDRELLEEEIPPDVKSAVQYRIGIKDALLFLKDSD